MQSRTLKMDRILSGHDMVSYLIEKGHVPEPDVRGRVKFCCPLPGHKDDSPSFVVFPAGGEDAYQSFWCFGCGRGGNYVHLVSHMEEITFREATAKLGAGVDITDFEAGSYILERVKRRVEQRGKEDAEMESAHQDVSLAMGRHLAATGYDPEEIAFCEEAVKRMDDAFAAEDHETVIRLGNAIEEQFGERLRTRQRRLDQEEQDAASVYSKMR